MDELVVVACHAIFHDSTEYASWDDRNWTLSDFQVDEGGEFEAQARCGVELAAASSNRLLVFSGGRTRQSPNYASEAASYRLLAERQGWWGCPEVANRCVEEEYARDSFENLLYGICRYREVVGSYPQVVRLVSWGFKMARFEMHREALRWPAERFRFHGVGNPHDLTAAEVGELAALADFSVDPYGFGIPLSDKRLARNRVDHRLSYSMSNPELAALLRHRGPAPFAGPLPW